MQINGHKSIVADMLSDWNEQWPTILNSLGRTLQRAKVSRGGGGGGGGEVARGGGRKEEERGERPGGGEKSRMSQRK